MVQNCNYAGPSNNGLVCMYLLGQGFDTQNYPKLQASLGNQPKNTHVILKTTPIQPIPIDFWG